MQRRYTRTRKRPQHEENKEDKYMEAALKQPSYDWNSDVMERPIIDPNWRTQQSYSRKEYMDELARRVGAHYGLADIREAQ